MLVQDYLMKMKTINETILKLIDDDFKRIESFTYNFEQFLDTHNIINNKEDFEIFLRILSKIGKNHYRSSLFFEKIQQIFLLTKESIRNSFTNSGIFSIFKGSKRMLLLLIKEGILKIDTNLANLIASGKYLHNHYTDYLYTEIQKFNETESIQSMNIDNFEEKRKNGENDSYVYQLIRNDLIIEFVSFVNQKNLPLSARINPSIFETNAFLIKNNPTLIEYSAFFGSIQIFNFLFLNHIELKPSLWLYAIHGRNPEIIHILERNHVKPNDESYRNCFIESIKCHHFEITDYIQSNLLNLKESEVNFVNSKSLKYFNFAFFPDDLNNNFFFFYLCKYNYVTLVKILLKINTVDVNSKIIFKKYFCEILHQSFKVMFLFHL